MTRLARTAGTFDEEWLLVTTGEDIRWLTGFSGSTATALLSRDGRARLFVDGRYVERAEEECREEGVSIERVTAAGAVPAAVAAATGSDRLRIDPHGVTAAQMGHYEEVCVVVRAESPLAGLRRVKDSGEIALIARAAAIAGAAVEHVVAEGLAGRTERQLSRRIESEMLDRGAHGPGFATIVATGRNGARPHHEPGECRVEPGHLVIIDVGAELDGYRSDMTRTVRVGPVSGELAEMLETVALAHAAGCGAVRPGATGAEVDEAARQVFRAHGVAGEYLHSTGHGVGLAIHEVPILSPSCRETLSEGEVVTVEPGLYRKGVGGARIEDLVVVTANGCRFLTSTPKDLSCPPSAPTT